MPVLTLDEVDLFYQERGNGTPAIFLHGFALDHTMWLDQLQGLASLRRGIAVDLRGFGRSGIGHEPGRAQSHQATDVVAVLERLAREPADLVGHSMGAHLALQVAAAAPDRVLSLALFGIMPREEYAFPPRSPDALLGPKEEIARRWADGMLAPGASLTARARTVAMAMNVDWAAVYPDPGAGRAPDAAAHAPGVPVLLATGGEDPVTPPAAVARLAARLGATFDTIPGAGHLPPVENPAAVTALLAGFWSGQVN